MCTLAVFRELSARYPLVVAANRDEFYGRPTLPPAPLREPPGVTAGLDLEANGTWFGFRNSSGPLVAGLLNRRQGNFPPQPRSAGQRSRGLLCLEALAHDDFRGALASVEGQDLGRYQSFNLFLAGPERAVVIDNASASGPRLTELGAGLSVLTGLDVNDPRCPRLASAVPRFEEVAELLAGGADAEELRCATTTVLADHGASADPDEAGPFGRLCVHTEEFGTRSASLLLVDAGGRTELFHADGPPCRTPLAPL